MESDVLISYFHKLYLPAQPPRLSPPIPADHATLRTPFVHTLRDPILEFGDYGRSYTTMHIDNLTFR